MDTTYFAGDRGDAGDTDINSLTNKDPAAFQPVSPAINGRGDGGDSDPFAPLNATSAYIGQPQKIVEDEILQLQPCEPSNIVTALFRHGRHGAPSAVHHYHKLGGVVGVVCRYDIAKPDGSVDKAIIQWSHGRRTWVDQAGQKQEQLGWHMKAVPAPRPLFGALQLTNRPDAPVLVCEGEKAVDAARDLFPDYTVVTSAGGSKAAAKTDWMPLHGKHVTIWPDADEAGLGYARDVADLAREAGALSVRIVDVPPYWPKSWDLADEPPAGVERDALRQMIAKAQYVPSRMAMPSGFKMTKDGLFFQPPRRKTDDAEPAPAWVCSPFEIVGATRTPVGEDWGVLIRWRDLEGRQHQWAIPRRLIHQQGAPISEQLEASGLACASDRSGHELLRRFIGAVKPSRLVTCVDRTGWHRQANGSRVFVLPGSEAFGSGAPDVVLQSDHAGANRAFGAAGTLDVWRRDVAGPAAGNDRLILFMSAAFAGPLLDLVGEPSGGLHLVGTSRSGKSTAALVAASVWGSPTADAQMRTWRGTANGLEGIAADTADTLLILDELGQADARDVGNIVYMLANEAGKQRASRTGAARSKLSWRTLFVSTGELTLAAKLGEAGKRAMAGLEVRLISIPADAGAGMGVFQNLHKHEGPAALAEHLRLAARANHGHAATAFLAMLTADLRTDGEALIGGIKDEIESFVAEHVPRGSSGQAIGVARRLGLCAAAGELASDLGVLPWQEGEARRGCAACFAAWAAERGSLGAGEDIEAVVQVRRFFEQHGASRFAPFEPLSEFEAKTINRAGWRRNLGNEGGDEMVEFLVLPEAWRTDVCAGLDPKHVARLLRSRGLLLGATDRHSAVEMRIPSEGKRRVYRVSGAILAGEA